jgi:Condensation domain
MTSEVSIPLSFEQEWFYFRHLLRPEESYPLTVAYDLSGHLDTRAFRLALHDLSARHQGMRLTIGASKPSSPRQHVNDPESTFQELVTEAVKCESLAQFQAYARAVAKHDQQMRWDPRSARQPRFRLLRWSESEHIFLSTFRHIDTDLTALRIFERELWMLYVHHTIGLPLSFSEAPSLARAICEQNGRYQSRAQSKNKEYWDRSIAMMPPVWQYTFPSGTSRETGLGRATIEFSRSLLDRLRLICHVSGCTMFHLILSVTAWLAFHATYQERLAVHVVVDARNIANKSTVGMFSSVHPVLFQRVNGGPADFLTQARRGVMQALTHHYVHGDDEIAATMRLWSRWGIEPHRALSVNYIEAPARMSERMVPPDLCVSPAEYAPGVPVGKAGLAVVAFDTEDTLRVTFSYNPNRISDSIASHLIGIFEKGLCTVAGTADGAFAADLNAEVGSAALAPLLDRDGAVSLHVDLEEVRTILLRHPSVHAADVHIAQHPDGGSEVVANLQVTCEVPFDELRTFCVNWPTATIYAIPPTRINQVSADRSRECVGGVGNRAAASTAFDALLRLLMDVLTSARPESEFWVAGGSFAAITELIRRARVAGLPTPDYQDFATPSSLAAIAERVAIASPR